MPHQGPQQAHRVDALRGEPPQAAVDRLQVAVADRQGQLVEGLQRTVGQTGRDLGPADPAPPAPLAGPPITGFLAGRVADVKHQLLELAPGHLAVGPEVRHQMVQGIGCDVEAGLAQALPDHGGQALGVVLVAGQGRGPVRLLEELAQPRAGRQVAALKQQQRGAGRVGEQGFDRRGQGVAGRLDQDQAAAAAQGQGGTVVAEPRRVGCDLGDGELAVGEGIVAIDAQRRGQGRSPLGHQAAVGAIDQDRLDLRSRRLEKACDAASRDLHVKPAPERRFSRLGCRFSDPVPQPSNGRSR